MDDDDLYDRLDEQLYGGEPPEPNCFTCWDAGGKCCNPNRWQRMQQAPGRAWRSAWSWWQVRTGRITFDDEPPF